MTVQIIDILFTISVLLFSVVFHEYAHGWVADRLGDSTARRAGRLTLNPIKHIDLFGMVVFPMILRWLGLPPLGWAKPVPVNFFNLRHPKRDMIWVAAAGPLTNFFIAVIASQLLRLTVDLLWISEILKALLIVNLVLTMFNLIPIPPLDGGRVVMGLLPDPLAFRYARIEPYGIILIIILMNAGWLDFVGKVIGFFINLLMGSS